MRGGSAVINSFSFLFSAVIDCQRSDSFSFRFMLLVPQNMFLFLVLTMSILGDDNVVARMES